MTMGEFKLRILSEKIEPRFGTYGVFMRDDSDFVMICEDIHATQVESGGLHAGIFRSKSGEHARVEDHRKQTAGSRQ